MTTNIQRPPSFVSTAWRVWLMTTPRLGRYLALGGVLCLVPEAIGSSPSPSISWIMFLFPVASMFVGSTSPSALGFLRARPVSRWSLMLGTIVPWVLLALVLPLILVLTLQESRFVGPGASSIDTGEKLRYLREIVGATFLPSTVPKAGLPPDVWLALRPLLYKHVLRVAMLSIASVFAVRSFLVAIDLANDIRGRWPRILLLIVTLAAAAPCFKVVGFWRGPWGPPPLWFAAVLAAAATTLACGHYWKLPRVRSGKSGSARPGH